MGEKNREYYISKIECGNIVAFNCEDQMFSGKVISVDNVTQTGFFTIKTKNGSVYYIPPEDIVWLKTGSHWPTGIYNALKLSKGKKI